MLYDGVDLTGFKFGPPKRNAKGGIYQSILFGDGNTTLKIQTPVLRAPFGLSRGGFNAPAAEDNTNVRIQLSFDEMMEESPTKGFYDFIGAFEATILYHAQRESKNLFNQTTPHDVVKYNFKSNLKRTTDFAPLMTIKVPVVNNEPVTRVWTSAREEVPLESIKKNSKLVVIAEPSSIWVVGTSWGVSWRALQVKIVSSGQEDSVDGYAFLPEGEEPEPALVASVRGRR